MKFQLIQRAVLIVAISSFLVGACASQPKSGTGASVPSKLTAFDHFQNTKGCFLLWNVTTKELVKVVNEEVCRERFPACSTFKVPLAVMAFDSKVLKSSDQVLKWNGVKDVRPEVNRDHNAKTWMRDSVVWFSQVVTPKMGAARVQKYLTDFKYGNEDLSAGLTEAWLVAPSATGPALKISAYEQLEFMKKLWADQLPVSKKAMQTTRDITYLETSPSGFKLNGKTGSNFYDKEKKTDLGWFIGHVERSKGETKQEFIAITTFSDLGPSEEGYGGPRAKKITKAILEEQGLW